MDEVLNLHARLSVVESDVKKLPTDGDLRDRSDAMALRFDKTVAERLGNVRGELKGDIDRLEKALDRSSASLARDVAAVSQKFDALSKALTAQKEQKSWGKTEIFQALAGLGGIVFVILQVAGFDVMGAAAGMGG